MKRAKVQRKEEVISRVLKDLNKMSPEELKERLSKAKGWKLLYKGRENK